MELTRLTSVSLLCLLALGCKRSDESTVPLHETQAFHQYWHAGKAEVSSYELNQSRYGQDRKGKAVMIFVTEDLSKKLQVKLDDPSKRNKINVLKLNYTKKFITGIYPYSLMLSVFTPTNLEKNPASVKAVMSSQEWCGQMYTQMNLRGNRYAVRSHSYFEDEADQQFSVRQEFLEDEIWNYIRLNHQDLPTGEIKVIPGLFFTRLHHADLKIQTAVAEKAETDAAFVYTVDYPGHERSISIQYEKHFPHKILGWKEVWKENGKTMQTTARLDKTLHTDYWTKNKNEFRYLRDSLNLPTPY